MKSFMISAQDAFERMERRVHSSQNIVLDQLDSCELAINQKLTLQCLTAYELATLKSKETFLCNLFFKSGISQDTVDVLRQSGWNVNKSGYYSLSIKLPQVIAPVSKSSTEHTFITAQEAQDRMYRLTYGTSDITTNQLEFCYLCFLKKLVDRPSLSETIKVQLNKDASDETLSTLKVLDWEVSLPAYPRKHIITLRFPYSLIKASRKNTKQ